jgi:hypothetical protein
VAQNYDELARRAARICTVESLDELRGGRQQQAGLIVQGKPA